MLPYYILLAIVMLIAWQYDKMSKKTWAPVVLIFIVMTLFIGLRDASVGTDTGHYARSFENFDYVDANDSLRLDNEPGWWILSWIGRMLGTNYAALLILIAATTYASVLTVIKKHSDSLLISLFVYITLCYFTFCVNAARQGIAVGIYMLSFPYLLKHDFKRYVLMVLAAAMFHKTVVVAIPMYFLFNMKYSVKTIAIMVLGSVALTSMLPVLLNYGASMEQRYQLYLEESHGGGEMLTVFYVAMAVYFIIQRKYIHTEFRRKYDTFLLMFISGSTIYLLVVLMGLYIEITRFAAYFQVAAIFLWPMILNNPNHRVTSTYRGIIILGHLGFMAIFLTRMANLVPYMLNSTLFD